MVQKPRMQTKILLLVVLCSLGAHTVSARELRTPLSFLYYWWTMYPLERPIEEETCWQFETTGGAYHREADSVFLDKNTTDREPISGTMFGKSNFTASEAFPTIQGSFSNVPNNLLMQNPLLNAAVISPRIGYSENGAYWGFALDREICNSCWRVGLRGTLPFRRIDVQLDDCCDLAETLDDMFDKSCDRVTPALPPNMTQPLQNSYAFRLDFLSSLVDCNNAQVVDYATSLRIAGIQGSTVRDAFSDFHVVKSEGKFPAKPYAAEFNPTVQALPFLSSTGNGSLANEDRRRFGSTINYSGATNLQGLKENQRSLWVVPTFTTSPTSGQVSLPAGATTVWRQVLRTLDDTGVVIPEAGPINFLQQQGIKFETSRLVGLGDFITQFYANWARDCWFFEGVFGVVWPTAYREKNPGNLLRALFPRGNNGHFEIQAAALGGWERLDWLKIKADTLYSYVTPRTERVAGSFVGETVKNIGPATEAKVSWHYFVTDVDFTFIHPKNCDIGLDVGYQAYIKLKDKVRFEQTQGTTLAGTMANFDPSVLELRTDVVAHKVRMQGFWQGDFFQFFGGWNHVFAGKNATRDTDWYIGASLYF